jgi:hypothetical protein
MSFLKRIEQHKKSNRRKANKLKLAKEAEAASLSEHQEMNAPAASSMEPKGNHSLINEVPKAYENSIGFPGATPGLGHNSICTRDPASVPTTGKRSRNEEGDDEQEGNAGGPESEATRPIKRSRSSPEAQSPKN